MTEPSDTKKLIDLVRRQAQIGKSSQAKRLLRSVGGMPRNSKKVTPKSEDQKK